MTARRPANPKPPAGLGAEARALWCATHAEYQFDSGADLALLGEMARTLDRLREVQRAIAKDGLVVAGSQGQTRANPLLTVEAEQRRALLAFARQLRLGALEV